MEQQSSSKLGKEYVKAIYCHPAYLTYIQSISCKMLGWINCKLDQDCWEKYQQPQIYRWYHSNPKGNQPWIFIGRTDAEAPILWPPNAKNWLTGKDPDAVKDWRQEEKGMTGWDGWMESLSWRTWVWVGSGSWWWTGKPGVLQFMGSQGVRHNLATEQTNNLSFNCSLFRRYH